MFKPTIYIRARWRMQRTLINSLPFNMLTSSLLQGLIWQLIGIVSFGDASQRLPMYTILIQQCDQRFVVWCLLAGHRYNDCMQMVKGIITGYTYVFDSDCIICTLLLSCPSRPGSTVGTALSSWWFATMYSFLSVFPVTTMLTVYMFILHLWNSVDSDQTTCVRDDTPAQIKAICTHSVVNTSCV